jgi:hypothetical protein
LDVGLYAEKHVRNDHVRGTPFEALWPVLRIIGCFGCATREGEDLSLEGFLRLP